jgi:probable F420-dependent oxidoreductase
MTAVDALGPVGIRSRQLVDNSPGEAVESAAELEELGFGALWVPARGLFERGPGLLAATRRTVVASSVASIWAYQPAELAALWRRLVDTFPRRVLLGIGASHKSIVDKSGQRYRTPVATMGRYLDALDSAAVNTGERIIAAIWPRMQELARDRSLGSHPYLVTPEHTHETRERLGPGRILAPAQVAVLETNRARARALARHHLANPYLTLPNYARNFLRLGFSEDDLVDGGSDALVDAIVAWGDAGAVLARVRAHLDAGADHVAIHVITGAPEAMPRREWRELAAARDG